MADVYRQCYDRTPQLQRLVLASHPSVIIAIDRWEIMDFEMADRRIVRNHTPEHATRIEQATKDTAMALTSGGARLVFIGLPRILSPDCGRPGMASSPLCRVPVSEDPDQEPYNAMLTRVSATVPNVSTIWITAALCPNGVCTWQVDRVMPRSDGMHFTQAGNAMVASILFRGLSANGLASK